MHSCERGVCTLPATHFRDTPWQSDKYRELKGHLREYACTACAQYEPGNGVWFPIFWAREVK